MCPLGRISMTMVRSVFPIFAYLSLHLVLKTPIRALI